MNKKFGVAAVLIVFTMLMAGFTVTSHAAQSQGDRTLHLSGGFIHAQGADSGTLNMDLGYGYFLRENWEVGLLQTLGYSFIDGAEDEWVASTIPYANYHFRGLSLDDTFQPFVGAFVGASYNEDDMTGTIGPQIGVKSFVNDSTFFTVRYRYEWFFEELAIDDIEDTSSDGNHVVTLGVGFVF